MTATTSGFRPPSNRVTQEITGPEYFLIGANATIAKMKPGVVVEVDSVAGQVKEFDGTGYPIGVIGYEEVQPGDYKPATRDTAFGALLQRIPVHVERNKRVRARLAASQTIYKGMALVAGADGLLSAMTLTQVITGDGGTVAFPVRFATADEAVTTDANGAGTAIWVILG
jgi:hypothetical protein